MRQRDYEHEGGEAEQRNDDRALARLRLEAAGKNVSYDVQHVHLALSAPKATPMTTPTA